jgi:hypothetical protein
VQANVITDQRELKVGENFMETKLVNPGKSPARLIKTTEHVP